METTQTSYEQPIDPADAGYARLIAALDDIQNDIRTLFRQLRDELEQQEQEGRVSSDDAQR